MRFSKMHGAGNDFLLFEDDDAHTDWPSLAKAWCTRRTGVGGDGLVVVRVRAQEPLELEVACYNADGSVATMCGNALRCAAWLAAHRHGASRMKILMAGVWHRAVLDGDRVSVTAEVGPPQMRRCTTVWNGRPIWFDAIHTGTEHVVAVVRSVEDIDAEACGRLARYHPDLAPLGTNVNFVQPHGPHSIQIRTYERGVEAETLSCGSGAVASAVIAALRGLVPAGHVVTVHNRAGIPLTVSPDSGSTTGRTYWVTGPVTPVFEGGIA